MKRLNNGKGRYKCVYHGKTFYGATEEEALKARDEYIQQETGNVGGASDGEAEAPEAKKTP